MKINAIQIKPGNVLEHNGRKWSVLKVTLNQPGKGNAFTMVEMRDIKTGNKTNERWRTQESVERLMVEEKESQYLFGDAESGYTFMDQETFEQFVMPADALGEQAGFLADGMEVLVDYIDGDPVSVTLPATVVMEVVEADAVVKGQTASSSYKPGVLENGMRVMIPPHIAAGTRIVVNTADCTYAERAKD